MYNPSAPRGLAVTFRVLLIICLNVENLLYVIYIKLLCHYLSTYLCTWDVFLGTCLPSVRHFRSKLAHTRAFLRLERVEACFQPFDGAVASSVR